MSFKEWLKDNFSQDELASTIAEWEATDYITRQKLFNQWLDNEIENYQNETGSGLPEYDDPD